LCSGCRGEHEHGDAIGGFEIVFGGPVQVGSLLGDQEQEEEVKGIIQRGHAHMTMGRGDGQPDGKILGVRGEAVESVPESVVARSPDDRQVYKQMDMETAIYKWSVGHQFEYKTIVDVDGFMADMHVEDNKIIGEEAANDDADMGAIVALGLEFGSQHDNPVVDKSYGEQVADKSYEPVAEESYGDGLVRFKEGVIKATLHTVVEKASEYTFDVDVVATKEIIGADIEAANDVQENLAKHDAVGEEVDSKQSYTGFADKAAEAGGEDHRGDVRVQVQAGLAHGGRHMGAHVRDELPRGPGDASGTNDPGPVEDRRAVKKFSIDENTLSHIWEMRRNNFDVSGRLEAKESLVGLPEQCCKPVWTCQVWGPPRCGPLSVSSDGHPIFICVKNDVCMGARCRYFKSTVSTVGDTVKFEVATDGTAVKFGWMSQVFSSCAKTGVSQTVQVHSHTGNVAVKSEASTDDVADKFKVSADDIAVMIKVSADDVAVKFKVSADDSFMKCNTRYDWQLGLKSIVDPGCLEAEKLPVGLPGQSLIFDNLMFDENFGYEATQMRAKSVMKLCVETGHKPVVSSSVPSRAKLCQV
jgi:hypothetical protein